MSANTADFDVGDPRQALDLQNIRRCLQRMEDSIIFSLIERAQYRANAKAESQSCNFQFNKYI